MAYPRSAPRPASGRGLSSYRRRRRRRLRAAALHARTPTVAAHAHPPRRNRDADLLPHGKSAEGLADRDADRRQAEELAALWREAARSPSSLAQGLLKQAGEGEEPIPDWLRRRFSELGLK